MERFMLRRKYCKDPTKVSKIIRRTNETLPDFKECWTEEMSYIQDVPEVMQIPAFISNYKCPELARRFFDQVPKTVTEMMKRVDDFVKSEEAFKSTELPKGEFSKKGQGTLYRGNRLPRPKEILATELQLQLPSCPPMIETPKKENMDRCDSPSHVRTLFRQSPPPIKARLTPTQTELVGLSGEQLILIGKVELEVTFRSEGLFRKTMMKFTVVRASSPYNVILGRTGMRELKSISSTIHAMIKFPTPRGIVTLVARTTPVYECRWSEKKKIEQEEKREEAEPKEHGESEKRKVIVHLAFLEQKVTIGT
ncbi:hypothetical protein Tco_1372972 [Tanacetum coccineum]